MTGTENDNVFRIEGKNYSGGPGPGSADLSIYERVSGDYFQTMGWSGSTDATAARRAAPMSAVSPWVRTTRF